MIEKCCLHLVLPRGGAEGEYSTWKDLVKEFNLKFLVFM